MRPQSLLLLALSPVLFAQSLTEQVAKAPPDVEQALRERANAFFQAHVDGKYRVAEQLVAEDSKDFYYEMSKPRFLSYELITTKFGPDWKTATVVAEVSVEVKTAQAGKMMMKPPVASQWKLENGQWFWRAPDQNQRQTPFGKMIAGAASSDSFGGTVRFDPNKIRDLVSLERNEVSLPKAGGSVELQVRNGMPGPVTLSVTPGSAPGLDVAFEPATLPSGQTARVRVTYRPTTDPPPSVVSIRVEPTGQVLTVKVAYTP